MKDKLIIVGFGISIAAIAYGCFSLKIYFCKQLHPLASTIGCVFAH